MQGAAEASRLRRVLVIDDEEPIRSVVCTVLQEEGYCVAAATAGEALGLATSEPPDVIILDIMMPIIDGPELRRRLLAHPRTASVPVVVMTAAGDAMSWAVKLGAVGALQKPFDIVQLIDLVEKAVQAVD
jgi:two-component system chemotaxis response regulator CheY